MEYLNKSVTLCDLWRTQACVEGSKENLHILFLASYEKWLSDEDGYIWLAMPSLAGLSTESPGWARTSISLDCEWSTHTATEEPQPLQGSCFLAPTITSILNFCGLICNQTELFHAVVLWVGGGAKWFTKKVQEENASVFPQDGKASSVHRSQLELWQYE